MDSNNSVSKPVSKPVSNSVSNFLVSRKNQVGLVLAILVVALHIAFGFGPLWPVAAAAAWGAGVALTQPPKQQALPPAPLVPTPELLRSKLQETSAQLRQARPPRPVLAQVTELEQNVHFVLGQWDHLQPTPDHRQTMWNIVQVYYPEVVGTYLGAPQFRDAQAVSVVVDSLGTLTRAAGRIRQGILDDNLRAMDSQAQYLRGELGDLPGLDDGYTSGPR